MKIDLFAAMWVKTGVYIVEITDGIYKERQQIIIQK